MGSETGPLSSPGTTSYKLPVVTIGLSHRFRSAPDVPDGETDGRNWSSNRRYYMHQSVSVAKKRNTG